LAPIPLAKRLEQDGFCLPSAGDPPLAADLPTAAHRPLSPLLQRYVFSWETMHTIIGGRSAIDLSHLRMGASNREEAYRFLLRYGYDVNVPAHVEDVERNRVEALGFIRGVLMPGLPGLDVPPEFDTMPVLDLLCLAAGSGKPEASGPDDPHAKAYALRMAWACALLRVMHTVSHAANYFQNNYYREIRERILGRFLEQVRTRQDGSQYLYTKSFEVPLVRFEVKETKPLRSVVLKLLQKQENVAYDLFDHIGVRIIVDKPVDALFAIRALREEHTILYPNVKPTRSRNTLVDLGTYDAHVRQCLDRYRCGEWDEAQTILGIHDFSDRPSTDAQQEWNPYSSDKYRSIQFTSRQMIRFANPLYQRLTHAADIARQNLSGKPLEDMLAALSLQGIDPEIQFFFPYEVQVMDIASYQQATEGRASYAEYKARQVASTRRRVMPRVLELLGLDENGEPPGRSATSGSRRVVRLRREFAATGLFPSALQDDLLLATRELS
jgi:uncharacterized protein (TIGR04562 family)